MLRLTTRQVNRYGSGERPRLRTRRVGRRILYHEQDVEELAQELNVTLKPKIAKPKTDLVPASEMLEYIRERDRQLGELQSQLNQALLEIGRLQGQLQETQHIRKQLEDVQAERDELREAIQQARPWYKRLFGD